MSACEKKGFSFEIFNVSLIYNLLIYKKVLSICVYCVFCHSDNNIHSGMDVVELQAECVDRVGFDRFRCILMRFDRFRCK